MPEPERKAYTDAINCLASMPSNLDPSVYPGATNRYLDYAAIHIERTLNVHLDGFFLVWHRMFIYLFEQDLRRSCGYIGSQPYWDWPSTIYDLHSTPIFNGDAYSMSSDGYPEDLNSSIALSPKLSIPHGLGGGCIMSGPFKGWNRTFNTIPTSILTSGGPLPSDAFAKNSTCLTRDLNPSVAAANLNQTAIDVALASTSMSEFQFLLNGSPVKQVLGIHSGAHFTVGDPGSNIFVSVQDPIWWPLHTMLDNLYVQWQALHPDIALQQYGTETAEDVPASANVTLETTTPDWGYFEQRGFKVGELVNNTAGPFCYRYE
ncbi:putative fad binding domain-containing protein [Phaeomoniella chlamydospora]|uniref:Putative fad binding domain-containing protein n=1 Tax=Phaeomoniella chlamydospora TaxID=158046 RepID=A0A0G2EUA6_PHACM|nr:putative fad binding domain-containing protein [Phaeomoniella chlamydospora]